MTKPTDADIPDASELLRQMRDGERTSEEIVLESLDLIEQKNPQLNAATEVFRDQALAESRTKKSGPLAGLPITVKETYGLAGSEVTIGSKRMKPIVCSEDSEAVKKLRDAGAIVIARSNVPEFVMNGETNNLLYGRTNHPLDQSLTSGGSTGGEGALIGSGCSPLGFGTDILGSIRIPSSLCGLVGFRPHSGAVDKTGVWPVSGDFFETWNGIGPIARSVRDVRLAYNVIANQPLEEPTAVDGLRLIIPRGFSLRYKDDCIEQAYQAAQGALVDAGMRAEVQQFSDVSKLYQDIPKLVTGEMTDIWTEWLSSRGEPFSPLAEAGRQLIGRPTISPAFFTWYITALVMKPRRSGSLAAIVGRYESARAKYHALLADDGVLVLPTLGLLAPKHGGFNSASLRPGVNGLFTADTFANYINLSAITVPAKNHTNHQGLKPGIMLACAPGAEAKLLDAAAALESRI